MAHAEIILALRDDALAISIVLSHSIHFRSDLELVGSLSKHLSAFCTFMLSHSRLLI